MIGWKSLFIGRMPQRLVGDGGGKGRVNWDLGKGIVGNISAVTVSWSEIKLAHWRACTFKRAHIHTNANENQNIMHTLYK